MNKIIRCEGTVRVALPPEESIHLFTPEGERRWAPGWDPEYPAGVAAGATGSVFITRAGNRTSTWVVVESGACTMRYARVTLGLQAGTIAVRCRPEGDGTVATIRYELTALTPEAAAELEEFERGYDAYMAEWERRIAAAVAANA